MHFFTSALAAGVAAVLSSVVVAAPLEERASNAAFFLAGDSTTATNGGWGDTFVSACVAAGSTGSNRGKSGTTTASFMATSSWSKLLADAKNSTATYKFVTIQFGHNDQKLGDSFKPQYKANLIKMAKDVQAIKGGVPVSPSLTTLTPPLLTSMGLHIITTSLTRRNFFSNGTVNDILSPWAAIALEAATAANAEHIDLWKRSLDYVQAIGSAASWKLNLSPSDHTHINKDGEIVFSRMVADLIIRGVKTGNPKAYLKTNATLTAIEDKNKPVF